MLEQLFAGEHLLRPRGQEGQEIELLRGEVDGPSVDLDPVGGTVDDQSVVLDLVHGVRRMPPPQDGADAGFELGQRAGLHDVVVGPEIEDTDPLGLLGPAGEHDHGQGAVPAQAGEDLVPVDPRQAQVEQDQVVLAQAGLTQGGRPVDRLAHVVAHAL